MAGVELGVGYISLVPSTRGLGKAVIADIEGVQRQTATSGAKIGNSVSAGFKKAVKGAGIGAALVAGLTIKKGFDRAVGIENARASLKGLGNSAKDVNSIMDNALASVRGTAFGMAEAGKTAAAAVGAGVKPGQQLTKYLKLTADAATIAGTDLASMGLIFNKIQGSGKLTGETLAQLNENGLSVGPMLAKSYGVSQAAFTKMVSQGKVDAATFQSVISKNIGGAALESGNTTEGAFKNLQASLGRIGEGLISGIFPKIKGGTQGITGALAPLEGAARTVGAAIGSSISGIAAAVGFIKEYRAVLVPLIAGIVAYKVATVGATVAEQALQLWRNRGLVTMLLYTRAQQGLNLAMRANPIGAVITALTLLGVGLVLAYKKSETFRNIVNGAWAAIKTGLSVAWGFIQPILASFRNWLGVVLPPVLNVLKTVAMGVFAGIRTYISVWWAVASKIFGLFVGFLRTTVFPVIRFLYENVAKPYFSALGTVISTVWSGVIKPVFGRLKEGVQGVGSVIGSVVGKIRNVWDGLKQAFAGPVDWVLKNVIAPLVSAVNTVSKALTGKTLIGASLPSVGKDSSKMVGGGRASGAARNGFAAGGWTGPGARLKPAGVVHADEFVMKKSSRRRLESAMPGGMDFMNRTGRWPGYAKGGRVKPLAGGTPSTYAGHTGVDFNAPNDFGKPIQAAADGVVSLVKHLRTSYGNYVQVRHAGGMSTIYAHMSKTLAKVGQRVRGGDVLGRVGSTGNSTGPHLHFEVRPGGTYSAAMAFLRGAVTKGGSSILDANPVGDITSAIGKIRSNLAGYSAKAAGFARLIGDGTLGTLGKQALAWARGKADKAATLVSPVYAAGKWLKGQLGKGGVKGAAKSALTNYGWGAGQFSPLDKLWTRESNWNPRAKNPSSGAYGIPQCLSLDAQILTRRGWLKHDEVLVGDETVGYNPRSGRSEWTRVTAVHHPGEAMLYEFGVSRWRQRSTANHRWLVERMVNDRPRGHEMVELQDMAGRHHRVVTARPMTSGAVGLPITDREAALLGWLAGDGWSHQGTWHGCQVRSKRWTYFEELLADDDNLRLSRERAGVREWRVRAPYCRDLLHRAGVNHLRSDAVEMVLAMSDSQRDAWLEALMACDAYFGDCTQLSQKEGAVADAARIALFMQGRRTAVTRDERSGNTVLSITVSEPEIGMRMSETVEAGVVEVWCVTTDLGTWTAGEGDDIFLTGNSLPGSKMASAGADWRTNPLTQIKWGLRYIKDRYGSPAKAWSHSQRTGWYADGGRVRAGLYDRGGKLFPGTTMVTNKSRKPEAVLTNKQWSMLKNLTGSKGAAAPSKPSGRGFSLLSDEQWAQVSKVLPTVAQMDRTVSVFKTQLAALADKVGTKSPMYKGLAALGAKFTASSSALTKQIGLVNTLSATLSQLREKAAAVVEAVTGRFTTDVFGITEGREYATGQRESLLNEVIYTAQSDMFNAKAFGANLTKLTGLGLTKPLLEQLAVSGNMALAEQLAASGRSGVLEFVKVIGDRDKQVAAVAGAASSSVYGAQISATQSKLASAQASVITEAAMVNALAERVAPVLEDLLRETKSQGKNGPAAVGAAVTSALEKKAKKVQQKRKGSF